MFVVEELQQITSSDWNLLEVTSLSKVTPIEIFITNSGRTIAFNAFYPESSHSDIPSVFSTPTPKHKSNCPRQKNMTDPTEVNHNGQPDNINEDGLVSLVLLVMMMMIAIVNRVLSEQILVITLWAQAVDPILTQRWHSSRNL